MISLYVFKNTMLFVVKPQNIKSQKLSNDGLITSVIQTFSMCDSWM